MGIYYQGNVLQQDSNSSITDWLGQMIGTPKSNTLLYHQNPHTPSALSSSFPYIHPQISHSQTQPYPALQPASHIQIYEHDSLPTKCEKILQINSNLTYNIALLQTQLEALKRMQKQKTQENGKQKQKIQSRLDKDKEFKRQLKAQRQRIRKMQMGLKNLEKQRDQHLLREEQSREKRVEAQDRKNSIYQTYTKFQQEYRQLLTKIKQHDSLLEELSYVYEQNQSLEKQIEQIQECLQEEKSYRDNSDNIKRERNAKIREFNEKVIMLDKEQKKIKEEIQGIQQKKSLWEGESAKIQEKSGEAVYLYKKVQQLKSNLVEKRAQYTQIDSIYKQLCIEQNKIKKQIVLKNQCEQQRRKYKEGLKRQKQRQYQQQQGQHIQQQHGKGEDHRQMKQMNYELSQNVQRQRQRERERVDTANDKSGHKMEYEDNAENRLQNWVKRYENIRKKNG